MTTVHADPTDQYQLPAGKLIHHTAKTKRVLCLTGGGFRGLFTAQVLARLEASYCDKKPIGTKIDFFAGTSVGGLLALGLATGRSASYMRDMLLEHGASIFPPVRLKLLRKLLNKSLYKPQPLERVIKLCLSSHNKGLNEIQVPLMLTTVSWSLGELRLLRSAGVVHGQADKFTLFEAARATSAAPTFFPAQKVDNDWFVDGGLAANAPDLHALAEARLKWGKNADIRILSIGTAGIRGGSEPDKIPHLGLSWASPALNLVMLAQERAAEDECRRQLDDKYIRLNRAPSADQGTLGKLDVATSNSKGLLTALADRVVDEFLSDPMQEANLRAFFR